MRLFADDIAENLTAQVRIDSDRLQRYVNYLQQYEVNRDMEFNPSKCQVHHKTISRNTIKNKYTMQIQNYFISLVHVVYS